MPPYLLAGPAAFAAGSLVVYLVPDRVRARSERFRQALALLSATGAIAVGGAATGLTLWDAALRAALAAAIVLLAARARPWPIFATTLVLFVISFPDGVAVAFAGGAFGVATATALTVRRRGPLLTSIVGILAAQAAFRLPSHGGFHGAESLAAAIALAPLMISGYRHLRTKPRRIVRRTLLTTGGVAALLLVPAAAGVLLARNPLEAALDASKAGLTAGREAETEQASRRFSAAASGFADARNSLETAWVGPARLLPIVGQHLELLTAASRAGYELSITAAQSASVAEAESIRVENGRLDLAKVRALERPLDDSRAAIAGARRQLAGADSGWIVPPLADRFHRQQTDLIQAGNEAEVALLAVRALPGLLGGDGPRIYFLAIQQPAELRGSGGIIGNYGELTAIDGDLEVAKFGRDGDLNAEAEKNKASLDGAPGDYIARYGRFEPERVWQNVSISPDFPSVAATIGVLYPQSGGRPVDGVISVDPTALAALLRITGPITVPPWPEPISADNAEQILHVDQYLRLEGQARVRFLGDVAETVTRHLTTGNLPPPPELARILAPAVRGRHLQLHSFTEREQALFERIGAAGRLGPVKPGQDYLAVINTNAGGNKLDSFLSRTVNYRQTNGALTVAVGLKNDAPTTGVPDILNGSFVGDPPGTNRTFLSIYTTAPLESATVDGANVAMESALENGLRVYSTFVVVPSGRTVRVELRVRQTAPAAELFVHHQPTIIPDVFSAGGDPAPLTEDRRIALR